MSWISSVAEWIELHDAAITAVSTVVIAAFTVALAIYTKRLGKMAVRQDARMRESVNIARASLVAGERAFVFPGAIGFQYRPIAGGGKRYYFQIRWINSGDTPTKGMTTHIRFDLRDTPLPENFNFQYETEEFGTALIAPRTSILGPPIPLQGVDPQDLQAVHAGTKFAYMYGWIKYFDVFPRTPQRITRFCYQVVVNGDPINPGPELKDIDFMYPLYMRNNCADEECKQAGA